MSNVTWDPNNKPPEAQNPANKPAQLERRRVPMSTARRKLEVPEIPGFYLYWFLDSLVPEALAAGYEQVKASEVSLNQHNVATSKDINGTMDLGSNVRVINGVSRGNEPEYLNLMKLRLEWHQEDQRALAQQNAKTLKAIFQNHEVLDVGPGGGGTPKDSSDRPNTYVKTALFSRKIK